MVTAISGDKCLDLVVKSKHCFGWKMWENKKGSLENDLWKIDYHCQKNHETSSCAMESSGAVDIFNRSTIKHKIIYKEYLGDGDTSSLMMLLDLNHM